MVDWILVGIGVVGTTMGLFSAGHFHSRYKRLNERTVQVQQLEKNSHKKFQFTSDIKKQQIIINDVLPHYTIPPKIQSKIHPQYDCHFQKNINGEDFIFVHRGNSEFTKVKASLNKTKINPTLLFDRKFNGKETGTEKFSRAKQLAILGLVGFDLANKEFYVECEMIGRSARDIVSYYESIEGDEIGKMILCLMGSFIAGVFLFAGIFDDRQND